MENATNSIGIQSWVESLGTEYLESYIREGGASVKFAVSAPEGAQRLDAALAEQAGSLGYFLARVNAADTRVYMPQDIFFAIARQVGWRYLARRMVVRLAEGRDFNTDGVDLATPGNIYAAIGAVNGLEAASVIQPLRVEIQEKISQNRRMARDFRVAMSHLCLLEDADAEGYGGELLLDWLKGINTRISNVRHFFIRTPVNRTTARHYLESALYWIQYAGYSGTVILLDNARVTLSRNPRDGVRFYSRPMVIDHYELLRELIDSADRLTGTLVVVAAAPDFLDENTQSRGFGIYEALMTRVMNDVRAKNQVNPMASLVRLS